MLALPAMWHQEGVRHEDDSVCCMYGGEIGNYNELFVIKCFVFFSPLAELSHLRMSSSLLNEFLAMTVQSGLSVLIATSCPSK